MTRLSHSDLEVVRKNPAAFAGLATRQFNGPSRFRYVVLSTKHYHNVDLKAGLAYLEERFAARGFVMTNLPQYQEYLAEYAAAFEVSGYMVHTKPWRMTVPVSTDFQLMGEVARLDITPSGYAAWLFKEFEESDWADELRMPIIQRAVAREMGAPENEVSTGFYFFEPATYKYRVYSGREIAAAERELRRVAASLPRL